VLAVKTVSIFFVVVCAVLSALTLSCPAWAMGPIDIEAAARVGGASDPINGGLPLAFGAGGRAGVSIFGIYADPCTGAAR
jgi:hypothetical protein